MKVHLLETGEEANEFLRWVSENPVLACDTETTGLSPELGSLRTIQFGNADEAWCIPCEGRWSYAGLAVDTLRHYSGTLVFHNSKFDLRFLDRSLGVNPRAAIQDTQTLAALVRPGKRVGLKVVAADLLGPAAAAGQDELSRAYKATGWKWDSIPIDHPDYWRYSCLDTILTYRVWEHLSPFLRDDRIRNVYDLEQRVIQCCLQMERTGLLVDVGYTRGLAEQWDADVQGIRTWSTEVYGPGFNMFSGPQVANALLLDGVHLTKRTPTGAWRMDEGVLKSIDHPLTGAVLTAKQLRKWSTVYLGSFMDSASYDGRIHPSIRTIGARTGRMSITSPPMQQLPRGSLVRDAIIPGEGCSLISIDYDGQELRIAGSYSGDGAVHDLFERGEDPHSYVAERMFGTEFTKDQRDLAKNCTYCLLFGGGAEQLATTAGVGVDHAAQLKAKYFNVFSGIKQKLYATSKEGMQLLLDGGEAYVDTWLGRRIVVPDNKLYKLFNAYVQGTAADVLKYTIVALDDAGYGELMRLPIHDEMIFEVPSADADGILRDLSGIMAVDEFSIPLTVSGEILHERWGDKYRSNDTPTDLVDPRDWPDPD
jgi:DNA polymerase-1